MLYGISSRILYIIRDSMAGMYHSVSMSILVDHPDDCVEEVIPLKKIHTDVLYIRIRTYVHNCTIPMVRNTL